MAAKAQRRIKAQGGCILTEAEETCVVYGMPTISRRSGAERRASPARSDRPRNHGANMSAKVLLVDDSGLARRSTRRHPRRGRLPVVEAEDGLSALERYSLEQPDVVLLDLVMKGMYGLEVLTKLGSSIRPRVSSSSPPISRRRRATWWKRQVPRAYRASRSRRSAILEMVERRGERSRRMELTQRPAGRPHRAAEHRLRPRRGALSQLTGHRVVLEVPGGVGPSDLGVELRTARGGGRARLRPSIRFFRVPSPATRC